MNASGTLRTVLAGGTLLLAFSGTNAASADPYQDRFCQLSKNLDVRGTTALKSDLATISAAFTVMKSFFVAYDAADQPRHLSATLFAAGNSVYDLLTATKGMTVPSGRLPARPITWASSAPTAGAFTSAFRNVYRTSADAFAVTESKNAALVKKATSMGRWVAVMQSQSHSADTSSVSVTEADALSGNVEPSAFASIFLSLLHVSYGLQTWPGMLDVLRTATTGICAKAKGMKAGGFVKTAADEYIDYLAGAAADFTRLEAFIKRWAPTLKAAAATLKSLESSLPPAQTALNALVSALTPLRDLKGSLDSAMAETLCLKTPADECTLLGDYPVKTQSWGRGSTVPARSAIDMSKRVERRLSAILDPVRATLPSKAPDLSAMNTAADKVSGVIGQLDSFFKDLETVIDISMDGEGDALQAIITELTNQKLE